MASTIYLFSPVSTIGRIVDRWTGGLGFSHAVIRTESGTWIDCTPKKGVHVIDPAERNYRIRPSGRVEIEGAAGAYVDHCAESFIGREYSDAHNCGSWIVKALPPALESWVEDCAARWRIPISPNALAVAFGVDTDATAVEVAGTGGL